MRVVVTGAGGFIGNAVCRAFVSHDCEVRALVSTPNERLHAPTGIVQDVRAAITDRDALLSLLKGRVDAVVHLAGPPSVRGSFDDPASYAASHTGGTAALLEVCRQRNVGHIVYVSSAEVYGRPRTDPVDEMHPLEARSPYAAAKIGAEQMVRAFDHAFGSCSTIIRPFSVYGPGMGSHALIPQIISQLGSGTSIKLGDLRPERDYCHVDDVARAIMAAAAVSHRDTAAINVGSGVGLSVSSVASMVLRLAGVQREVEEVTDKRRPGNADILRMVADRGRARSMLNWEPKIALTEGLYDMVNGRSENQ